LGVEVIHAHSAQAKGSVSGNGKDTKYGNGGSCGYLKRDYHPREYWVSKEG
jgi:hypothetical protein